MSNETQKPNVKRVISKAFEGDQAPAGLSAGIVSLVEFCKAGMPDPARVREQFKTLQFNTSGQANADAAARLLALDTKIYSKPVRNLRNEMYGAERNGDPVVLILSEGETDDGKIVFLTTLFRGAIEADAVKAVTHVAQKQPLTGSNVTNLEGVAVRRVFWDVNEAGIRGMVVSGPDNVESMQAPRAITAYNLVGPKR